MASSGTLIIFFHALFIILLGGAWAETERSVAAPSPSSSLPPADCLSELLSLSGCLPYVQAGSTVAKPDASCCSPLKKVVKEKPACLCQAFGSSSTFGISLNITKALSLPSACSVKTPSVSNCNSCTHNIAGNHSSRFVPGAIPISRILSCHLPSNSIQFSLSVNFTAFSVLFPYSLRR
ncbi:hypothetical protein IEQ34_015995 [Dendrobium chrysotoxum]|uniref:Bifunctional inhibitor/plant lipid transfer protein/seed storage helical domain-containing protein n=1 Tax=Dendrobium chrysotoxum TaxID=161865 RepID=A0AAV7GJZ9_DENCH|nr:hypothetical protein IEQ34_015995 [Dendrobium chrysotoxum]